jgi:hypothetical protein
VVAVFSSRFSSPMSYVAIAVIGFVCTFPVMAGSDKTSKLVCAQGATLASGDPDPTIFADEASRGVRAFWCERYDAHGNSTRTGPYQEIYSNGRARMQANYVDSRLEGPVTIRHEDGSLFVRGFLEEGEWSGALEIFHPSGATWFEARFESGQLEGILRTRFPDGALESETRYQAGREDGLARSFYSSYAGGGLKSEAHVEADQIVGRHRLLDREGEPIDSIERNTNVGPAAWRGIDVNPAAADFGSRPSEASDEKRDLRD